MQQRGKSCWVQVDVRAALDAEGEMHRVMMRRGKSGRKMRKRGIGAGEFMLAIVKMEMRFNDDRYHQRY